MSDKTTISTPDLWALVDEEGVEVGRYFSVERGRAQVELVTPDRVRWVTVVDPEP